MSDARYRFARAFLIGGGAVSWAEWRAMSAEEQAALVRAGEVLRREAAVMAGNATRSAEGAAEVISPVDDGLELEAQRVAQLIDEVGP